MRKGSIRLLIVTALFLALASPAMALQSYWDVGEVLGGTFGTTDSFEAIQYLADTTSYISASGAILDKGNGIATSLIFPGGGVGVDQGLNSAGGYQFHFSWEDLGGQVTFLDANIQKSVYSGGTINFYLDSATDAALGSAIGVAGDVGFNTGTLVATVDIVSGYNNITFDGDGSTVTGGSYNLTGLFRPEVNFYDNFWFEDGTGEDLKEKFVSLEWLVATTNGDNDPDEIAITLGAGVEDGFAYAQTINARHDASLKISAVPEPSTFILLGAGLAGLGFYARRRKQ